MVKLTGVTTATLAVLAAVANGSAVNREVSMSIRVPENLRNSPAEGFRPRTALFGIPPYDHKLSLRVFYAGINDPDVGKACEPFDNITASKGGFLPDDYEGPFALMVDRNDAEDHRRCHFVKKVLNAQKVGASAVIVADSLCRCDEGKNNAAVCGGGQYCEAKSIPYMADDGTGDEVKIPSVMIDKYEASVIKDALKEKPDELLVVNIQWESPDKTKEVEWELWTSMEETTAFKTKFSAYADKVKSWANFKPRYFVWDGAFLGCTGDECGSQCINNGNYCNPDPDGALDSQYSGGDIVWENYRQACIWNEAKKESTFGEKWWTYVDEFQSNCVLKYKEIYENGCSDCFKKCSEKIQDELGIDKNKVDACHKNFGKGNLLQEFLDEREGNESNGFRGTIVQLPSLVVNHMLIREGVTPVAVMESLCESYAGEQEICTCVANTPPNYVESTCLEKEQLDDSDGRCFFGQSYCSKLKKCVSDMSTCPTEYEKSVSGVGVFFIIVAVVSLVGGVGFVYYHHTKRQMRAEMQSILAEYMPLEEMNNQSTGSRGNGNVGLI